MKKDALSIEQVFKAESLAFIVEFPVRTTLIILDGVPDTTAPPHPPGAQATSEEEKL